MWRIELVTGAAQPSPVLVEDRVQHLIEVLAVAQKRLLQNGLLHRADLAERADAAAVPHGGARLEPVYT